MSQEAAVPPGFWGRVQKMIDDAIASFARSGFLRNASITQGGLTISNGGTLKLRSADDVDTFYVGPVTPALWDGSSQPGLLMRRNDGTLVLSLYDAFPTPGGYSQALAWWDRSSNTIIADDTNSGQGIARPYIGGGFGRARYADMSVSTTSSTFETVWETRLYKQQPQLEVGFKATMDTTATTGEVRVLVNGTQIGPVKTQAFSIATQVVGPAPVQGAHMDYLTVEIQARRTSATGACRVEALYWTGRQS